MVGIAFRKTYYDTIYSRVVSEFVPYTDMVINNQISSLSSARRITQKLYKYKNDIIENIRLGMYRSIELDSLEAVNSFGDTKVLTNDDDAPTLILEQHCYLDLDNDDYREPYIVLMHASSGKVLRITRRFEAEDIMRNEAGEVSCIKPEQYFTDFWCLPSPDGNYWPMGFGQLLFPITNAVSSLLNMLIDSGTLQNSNSFFYSKDLKLRGGPLKVSVNEGVPVDLVGGGRLQDKVFRIPTSEPSSVLFQLLGLLTEASKDLASLTNTLLGKGPTTNVTATTTQTLQQEGLTVYNSIQKRLFASFKDEFDKQYRLNKKYITLHKYEDVLDEPVEVLHTPDGVVIADFETTKVAVTPVFDPTMVNANAEMSKCQILLQTPGIDTREVAKMIVDILDIDNPHIIAPPPDPNAPPAPEQQVQLAAAQKAQAEAQTMQFTAQSTAQLEAKKLEIAQLDAKTRAQEAQARILKMNHDAQVNTAKTQLASVQAGHDMAIDAAQTHIAAGTAATQAHLKAADLGLKAAIANKPENKPESKA
jgi:chaperonin GroES